MINTGDTAFMLVATALVMLMTPGLALFYGGLVRSKNVLTTVLQSFISIGPFSRALACQLVHTPTASRIYYFAHFSLCSL